MKTILEIIEETFSEEISCSASEQAWGLEAQIEGKEDFLKKIEEKLKAAKII